MSDYTYAEASLIQAINADNQRLRAENERLREALKKLRDCDWTITLPDRMDAVRDMAKQALSQGGEGV
jgi:cell division protein FtsB